MPVTSRHAEADNVAAVPPSTPITPPRRPAVAPHASPVVDEYLVFAGEVLAELDPRTTLERVLAERVMLAAWRLHVMSRRDADVLEADGLDADLPPVTRDVLRAESSLETALTMLDAVRRPMRAAWGVAAPNASKAGATAPPRFSPAQSPAPAESEADNLDHLPDLSNEWPDIAGREDEEEEREAVAPGFRWSERLVFDDNVSTASPVVRGTWVTASQVVSLIVDGWSWSDVLRDHPELTEDDVRACLAYTIENDRYGD